MKPFIMYRYLKILAGVCFVLIISVQQTLAQCAMCRTTIENNVSQGEDMAFGAGLNTGILLLLFAPYALAAIVGLLWYKNSKGRIAKLKGSHPIVN